MRKPGLVAVLLTVMISAGIFNVSALEKRDDVSYLRGPYNGAFFHRHNNSFRESAALHFAHGKQHDVLILNPLSRKEFTDRDFLKECLLPDMKKSPESMKPGIAPDQMIKTMMEGWKSKYGNMADIETFPLSP